MSLLDTLRRPEHTGENRCWPCTLANVAIVVVGALVVARRRKLLSLVVTGAGLTLIWLRGYVVPYTPTFAPKLVEATPVPDDWFHTDPPVAGVERRPSDTSNEDTEPADDRGGPDAGETGGLSSDSDPGGEELLGTLLDIGVLSPDGDAVELDDEFAAQWDDAMSSLATLDTDSLADEVFEVAHAASVSVADDPERDWVVLADGSGDFDGETWLTRPVAIAETGAVAALEDYLPDEPTRRAAAGSLLMFLSACPDCGEPLVESTTATCCGSRPNPMDAPDEVLACPSCQVRLFTFEN